MDKIGIVLNEEAPCYKHEVRIYPNIRKYEDGVVKYTCPVCDLVGDRHQIGYMESRCPICGVNLIWLDKNDCSGSFLNNHYKSVQPPTSDSETIAKLLDEFEYHPEQAAEILSKYKGADSFAI